MKYPCPGFLVFLACCFNQLHLGNCYYYYRIVSGFAMPIEQAPYNVGLLRNGRQGCGGALVIVASKQIVVTAAHCVTKSGTTMPPDALEVIAGSAKRKNGEIRKVQKVIVHEAYDDQENDIALLLLEADFELSEKISPVSLPDTDDDVTELLVTGWGRLKENGQASATLQGVILPVISNQECHDLYSSHYGNNHDRIRETNICTFHPGGGKDACQGDSGGPAVLTMDNGPSILIGVVSWGVGCARADGPGVYTRVTKFVDWIEAAVSNAGT